MIAFFRMTFKEELNNDFIRQSLETLRSHPLLPVKDKWLLGTQLDRQMRLLVRVLNETEGESELGYTFSTQSRDRVTEAARLAKGVVASLRLMEAPESGALGLLDLSQRCRSEVDQLNRMLQEVRTVPYLEVSLSGRSVDAYEHLYVDPKSRAKDVAAGKNITGTALNTLEQSALLGLLHLIKTDQTDTLRRCECGDWYIAVRSDQKSCSATCRQRRHSQTDAFKATRRNYRKTKGEMAKAKVKRAEAAK